MEPIVLGPNQVHRFYRGGPAICQLRGTPSEDEYAPEDWIGSATAVFGTDRIGISTLPDGRAIPEAMAADPEAFFGPRHAERFGGDPRLLVKLLEAGERLPVHCHPDRSFARRHLDCRWGKTEAWVTVGVRAADSHVFLGFGREVDQTTLSEWVREQRTSAILGAMNRIPVEVGDTVLVPAGTPHAIGEGVFLVELQEPTDLSVLLEWEGFDVDGTRDGHLGLGFDRALSCVDRSGWDPEPLRHLLAGRGNAPDRPGVEVLFPWAADPFFRAERIRPGAASLLPAAFSIMVVTAGDGRLEFGGGTLDLGRGSTVLVPFASGDCRLAGRIEVIRCMPPDPEEPEAPGPAVR